MNVGAPESPKQMMPGRDQLAHSLSTTVCRGAVGRRSSVRPTLRHRLSDHRCDERIQSLDLLRARRRRKRATELSGRQTRSRRLDRAEHLLYLADPYRDDDVAGRARGTAPGSRNPARGSSPACRVVPDHSRPRWVCPEETLQHRTAVSAAEHPSSDRRTASRSVAPKMIASSPGPPMNASLPSPGAQRFTSSPGPPNMMSLFGGPPGAASAVRSTEDDVPTWTAVHHVVAVQAKHHVIARPAFENVGAVEGLVRRRASLNRGVVLPVVVASDEELRPFAAVGQRRLRGDALGRGEACARDEQARRKSGHSEAGNW